MTSIGSVKWAFLHFFVMKSRHKIITYGGVIALKSFRMSFLLNVQGGSGTYYGCIAWFYAVIVGVESQEMEKAQMGLGL